MSNIVTLLDTTLRDGAQSALLSLSSEDKRHITSALDGLGITYVEAGYPAALPGDRAFFADAPVMKNARLTAFGATRRKDSAAERDAGLQALLDAGTDTVCVFGKSWTLHVTEILGCTSEENLNMIADSVRYLKAQGREVIYDAEHFFDGWREDPDYALRTLQAAQSAGADILCLCDTCGGAFPDEVFAVVGELAGRFTVPLGIHAHNDAGMADAVSVMAVLAGARHVQGTLCGLGERCGNANLVTVAAGLQLKRGYRCLPEEGLPRLTAAARFVSEICNVRHPPGQPYTGAMAFTHKAGMHIDGVQKNPAAFEHIPPESVGNTRATILSDHSGRAQLLPILRRIDPALTREHPAVSKALELLKERQQAGYAYEAAEASFELLARRMMGCYEPFFALVNYTAFAEEYESGEGCARALVKVRVGGEEALAAGEGEGPVNALDSALRRALKVFYPRLSDMRLTDYKVRVLNPRAASAAQVRVLITSGDGRREWGTVGVSADIISASWQALCDSVRYFLISGS